ncbi:MAG: VOC family protein [Syntrophaceae bacterium]|nr:VOC family protein [Syntrophaceae bacterium]
MLIKIEHIGIVVKDLEERIRKYTSLLGLKIKEIEEVKVENVVNRVAFLPIGETNIELVQTTGDTGLAADFLKERGEGIHHIAFEVEDLDKTFQELRSKGVEFVWDQIIRGSRGSMVAVIKPEEFNGVYIELVQRD